MAGARIEGSWNYSYANLQDHFERTIRYARISADALERAGKQCRWYHLVFSPWLALFKRLIVKQGFRDGRRGWIIAYTTFFSVLAKYAYLYEKRNVTSHTEKAKANPPDSESGR